MRVALVCPYDLGVPGGVQSHVLHLARELQALGDVVVVLAPGDRDDVAEGTVPLGRSVGIRFNGSVAPLALTPAAARRTLVTLRGFEPDIVHVHEPAAPLVSVAASLRGPRPLVGTFHAWSDRALAYTLVRPLLRPLAQRLDARIAVSPAAADYHARALGLRLGTFRVIPNGVAVGRFAHAEALPELEDPHRPTVLFVGRLERRKGLEQLIRAFVAVKSTRPDVRLLIVGTGPERDRCQSLLPARLRADAIFLGSVDQDTLPRVYAASDVVAVPAVGGESFGIVLLEAMAAGRPVVASDIPGFRAVVRDGVEGRLVPPGDVRSLTQALAALLANPALRSAMSAEAHATVADYDWPRVTARIRQAYQAVRTGTGDTAPELDATATRDTRPEGEAPSDAEPMPPAGTAEEDDAARDAGDEAARTPGDADGVTPPSTLPRDEGSA